MKFRFLPLWLSAVLAAPLAGAQTQPPQDAHLWLTTGDRANLLTEQPAPLHFSRSGNADTVIDVNDMQQYQPIEGFGFAVTGGSAELLMRMTPAKRTALLREVFSPQGEGIHASYLRVSIGSSDMNDHPYTYDDLPAGQTDPQLAKFSLDTDRANVIPVLKEILEINPQIPILGSPWSAPAWMKTNDKLKGGHLKPEDYGVYAQYFVKYIEGMKAEGIRINAVTIQNEPLNPKNTPSMAMFAPEEAAFIAQDLGPAFRKAGISTRIQVYDHNADVPSYPLSIFDDPAASQYVEGAAFHFYGGEPGALTQVHDEYPDKKIFLTEQSVTQDPHSSDIDISDPVDGVMIGATRNWSRNVLLWNLAANPNAGPHTNDGGCPSCWGAITLDGDNVTKNLAWYVLGHVSKFVPPGSVRVGSNNPDQLHNVAFLTPEGKVVLVVSNTGNFPRTFGVRYHGQMFTTSLEVGSVGTYVW